MSNQTPLAQLQAGIRTVLEIAGSELQHSSETDARFSLRMELGSTALGRTTSALAPFSDLFDISFDYRVQQGSGTAVLSNNQLIAINWHEDPDLNPPDLSPTAAVHYVALARRLSRLENPIELAAFADMLNCLAQAGAELDLFLRIFFNKEKLTLKFGLPERTRCLIYVSADKFHQQILSKVQASWDLLIPGAEDSLVLLLGDATGTAQGPNILICGRDSWSSPGCLRFKTGHKPRQKVIQALKFREAEASWEINKPALTPYHLHIETTNLNRPDILATLAHLRNNLAVLYLADRTRATNGTLRCQFRGQKRAWITLPALKSSDAGAAIFDLFDWAYESSSSDKLNIVRQIISLQLGDNQQQNYAILLDKATDILGAAKSNFQIFLRRSVELYFDRRLKISEFIQEFSEEIGSSVSKLTSELISNLYRTVGIILGVVIAILVQPDNTPFVIYLTSLLYLLYIVFILAYLLPASYMRFRHKVYEYRHSLTELRDVLSSEEISRLQGNTFRQSQSLFLVYFTITNMLYALLGLAAYTFMRFFKLL